MTFDSESQGYYYKFLELQEKLRRSEEDRMNLEIKLNEMLQQNKEEEQQYYRALKSQYKDFVKTDTHRMFRNEQILQALEKIEMKISLLSAKTQRFKVLRQHYQTYLDRTNSVGLGKTNLSRISGILEEKDVLENTKQFSLPRQEEKGKVDSNNHNYVYNYLKRNNQNVSTQQKPDAISQLNSSRNLISNDKVLPLLYSFSQNRTKNPSLKTHTNSDNYPHGYQDIDDTRHILPQNTYLEGKYSPRQEPDIYKTSNHTPGYTNSGTYGKLSKSEIEFHRNYPSNSSIPYEYGNILTKNHISPGEHKNIISPEINRNRDDSEKSLYRTTYGNREDQIKAREIQNSSHDFNHNTLFEQSESYQQPKPCENENLIIGDGNPLSTNDENESMRNKIVDSSFMGKEEKKAEPVVPSQIPEANFSGSPSKVELENYEIIQNVTKSKSADVQFGNQIHINNHDLNPKDKNCPVQMTIHSDEKISDWQNSKMHEQKNIDENARSSIEPNPINSMNAENANENAFSVMPHVIEHDDFNTHVEISGTDMNNRKQENYEGFIENMEESLEKTGKENSQVERKAISEFSTAVQEQAPVVTVQNDEEILKSYEDSKNEESNQKCESLDQFQAYNKNNEQHLPTDEYHQYVQSGIHPDGAPTENSQEIPTAFNEQPQDVPVQDFQSNNEYENKEYEQITETNQNCESNDQLQTYDQNNEQNLSYEQYDQNVKLVNEEPTGLSQEIPTTFKEEVLDVTVQDSQSNKEYEHDKLNPYVESDNINTNQNYESTDQFQTYDENNQQYLSNDQYPQYVQSGENINYDHSSHPTNYQSNEEQPYNMPYDEKNPSYMPYDVNNQEYDQQYYQNDPNYANYDNGVQQYDQLQYDQYTEENYHPPDQQVIYDSQEQEQLNTNEATPGDYYSETEYNQNVPYQEVDKDKSEPVSQIENNGADNMTKLVNILETDSENISDPDIKVSNESDFDFSVTQ